MEADGFRNEGLFSLERERETKARNYIDLVRATVAKAAAAATTTAMVIRLAIGVWRWSRLPFRQSITYY